jgi:hypothetical protein
LVRLVRSINGAIGAIVDDEENLKAMIDISFERFIAVTRKFYEDIQNNTP